MVQKRKYLQYVIFHPLEGFDEMRQHDGGSLLISNIVFIFFSLSVAFKQRYLGKQFHFIDETAISLPTVLVCCIGLMLTIVFSNWAISVLLEGKAKLKDIWIILSYSLVPYTVSSYLYILISNLATAEEGMLLNIIIYVGVLWSAVLVVRSLMTYQEFSFSGTIGSLILTAIGVIIILFLVVLMFSLFQQLFGTLSTIFYEITFRLR